jgi:uncharacterized membrane protein YeaQ/YmgE (transglycosylase-associated protein family)
MGCAMLAMLGSGENPSRGDEMEGLMDALGAVSLTLLVAIGLVAGWIAGRVTGRNTIGYMVLGVGGAVALPFVLAALGIAVLALGGLILVFAVAAIGALVLIMLGRAIFGERH